MTMTITLPAQASTAWYPWASNLDSEVRLISLKAPLDSPTFTGVVSGITKAMVGLTNVDNTSDLNKPISSATQTALSSKLDVDNLLDQTLSVLPKTTVTVVYNTTNSTWTLPSGLGTRADIAWLFQGGDAAHLPPTTTGPATWVRALA